MSNLDSPPKILLLKFIWGLSCVLAVILYSDMPVLLRARAYPTLKLVLSVLQLALASYVLSLSPATSSLRCQRSYF